MDEVRGEHPLENGSAGALGSEWAAQVREARRVAGLTQLQLAEAAGVSVGALRDLEQDRTARPRREFVRRLGDVLGLIPDQPDRRRAADGQARAGAVRLRVLGPLTAWRGGLPVELGAARQRAVLGLLALRPNVALHRETIVEALWTDDVPAAAVKMVQIYVGRLRRQLDPGRLPGDRDGLLVSSGTRYLLRADARQLDLLAFGRLADRARQAGRRGDAAAACDLYVEALGLWRGEPLADLDLLSAHPVVIGLAGRRADVVADFAETAIAAGRHDRALPYLQAAAERDPLDERAHAWLMIALAGTGRQAAALAVYHRLRQRLDEQLGVRPGPVLAQAQERVLRQDVPAVRPGPDRVVAATAAPTRAMAGATTAPPRQLPRGAGAFVGREPEFAALRALAGQAAEAAMICVIDGVAGVGKTAFAIHAGRCLAERFPDGQLYADLRGVGPLRAPMPPAEALTGFLRALGVEPRAVPGATDEQAAMYRSLLDGRRMLIVLDNAADPGQVRPLLPGSPGPLVLVTSRGRLSGLTARDGARRLTLGPLAEAEAIVLLDRILGPDRVRAEPEAARDISARCGHLPLALRIVADRAADRGCATLADLAGQLAAAHDLLDVLDSEDEATAIRAVFSWSYQALAPAAARMFRLLGLHAGPDVSVPAAAALAAAGPAEAGRLLDLLAGVHLIEEAEPGRYRLHDLLRVYAAEQVQAAEDAGGREAALRRMLVWYLHTAVGADQVFVPGRRHPPVGSAPPGCEPLSFTDYEQALAWCDAEYANLTAAVRVAAETGQDDVAWKFPVALRGFFGLRRPWAEGLACADIGLAAARRAGDRDGQAWTLDCLGHAHSGLGRFEDALRSYTEARTIRRETGDRWGESANSMNNLGCTYVDLGQFDLALDCFRRVLAAALEAGNKYVQCLALANLGDVHSRLGRNDHAVACLRQAVEVAHEIGYRQLEGTALSALASAYRVLRQPGRARDHYLQALAVRRQAGDRHGEAEILRDLGDLSRDAGHARAARRSWGQALVIMEDLGDAPACADIRGRLDPPGLTGT